MIGLTIRARIVPLTIRRRNLAPHGWVTGKVTKVYNNRKRQIRAVQVEQHYRPVWKGYESCKVMVEIEHVREIKPKGCRKFRPAKEVLNG